MENSKFMNSRYGRHFLNCLLCCVFLVCSASTCADDEPDERHYVQLVNDTSYNIYVGFLINGKYRLVPSDILMEHGLDGLALVKPGESLSVSVDFNNVNEAYPDCLFCQFLVFHETTIENHSVQEIMTEYIYDKRLVYSSDELEKRDYIVRYSGS